MLTGDRLKQRIQRCCYERDAWEHVGAASLVLLAVFEGVGDVVVDGGREQSVPECATGRLSDPFPSFPGVPELDHHIRLGAATSAFISRSSQIKTSSSFETMSSAAARRHVARSVQSFASSQADKQPPAPPKPAKPPSLARRLLFPHIHPDADLPPLLVSPAATPELNDELYGFVAIALRAYVHPWWTKITRYDKEFLPDITRVLTVAIRSLEARIVRTDLSPLILRDLPSLLSQHYQDFRNSQAKLHTSYASGGSASLAQLFHQAQPHMTISADGTVDDAYIRQAFDEVLRLCLPPEDYEADSERFIIREVLVMVVVRGVLPRLTQPWFIHQQLLGLLGPEQRKLRAVEVCIIFCIPVMILLYPITDLLNIISSQPKPLRVRHSGRLYSVRILPSHFTPWSFSSCQPYGPYLGWVSRSCTPTNKLLARSRRSTSPEHFRELSTNKTVPLGSENRPRFSRGLCTPLLLSLNMLPSNSLSRWLLLHPQ